MKKVDKTSKYTKVTVGSIGSGWIVESGTGGKQFYCLWHQVVAALERELTSKLGN